MPTKILCVAGARPNFIKIAPLMRVLGGNPRFVARLIHTGQHYDAKLSKVFFEDLKIPKPDIELEIRGPVRSRRLRCLELRPAPRAAFPRRDNAEKWDKIRT